MSHASRLAYRHTLRVINTEYVPCLALCLRFVCVTFDWNTANPKLPAPLNKAHPVVSIVDNLYSRLCLKRVPSWRRSRLYVVHHIVSPSVLVHVPFCSIRSLGSAALNACMVACGSVDGYFEYGVHCWDIAASVIIVREAGGVVLYPTGEDQFIMPTGVV